jgi:hypothetical protein
MALYFLYCIWLPYFEFHSEFKICFMPYLLIRVWLYGYCLEFENKKRTFSCFWDLCFFVQFAALHVKIKLKILFCYWMSWIFGELSFFDKYFRRTFMIIKYFSCRIWILLLILDEAGDRVCFIWIIWIFSHWNYCFYTRLPDYRNANMSWYFSTLCLSTCCYLVSSLGFCYFFFPVQSILHKVLTSICLLNCT